MAYKYKVKNGEDFFIPGVGASVNGIITTDKPLEGSMYILVEDQPVESTAPVAAEGAVIGVAPQATATPEPVAPQPTPNTQENK